MNINLKRLIVLAIGLGIWFSPGPASVDQAAWHLFAVFFCTILAVILDALPILTASIIAVAVVVLTGVLTPAQAYSGFGEPFILLIICAFLVSRAVVNSGLGQRIALMLIRRFGQSSLGLGYSMVATDMLIAVAFPSNTARSGVLYPIVESLALDSGSKPDEGSRRRIGAFLMFNSMAGLSLSSSLWLTAMAANPVGAAAAAEMGVRIEFGSWFLAAVVPTLVAFLVIPRLLYLVFPPEMKATPEAPQEAARALTEMGSFSRHEWVTAFTFGGMVLLWALSGIYPIDKTAVAFAGLGVLMVTGVFTVDDMKQQGDALSTLIWFAVLYTMSSFLNSLGFMTWVGDVISGHLSGVPWFGVYVILVVGYVLIHYFFVSQTAQMLALFPVFLAVGVNAGVPGVAMALMLLFATNFNSAITPQGSSANVLFASSGYLTMREMYRNGALVTGANTVIYMTVGTLWFFLLGKLGILG